MHVADEAGLAAQGMSVSNVAPLACVVLLPRSRHPACGGDTPSLYWRVL